MWSTLAAIQPDEFGLLGARARGKSQGRHCGPDRVHAADRQSPYEAHRRSLDYIKEPFVVLHPPLTTSARLSKKVLLSQSAAPQSTDIGRHSEEGSCVP